jgi:hypothetical protein
MNVYLLPHIDGKSFKIGKANCIETRMKKIGMRYFSKQDMYYIKTESDTAALHLESKLHKVFKIFNMSLQGFDGCTEFFNIDCLPSVLSLFNLGIITGYKIEDFNINGVVARQKPVKVKKVKVKVNTYKGDDITDDFKKVCFIRYVSYLVKLYHKLSDVDITPPSCKWTLKNGKVLLTNGEPIFLLQEILEWSCDGDTTLIGKSGSSWIVESTLRGMITGTPWCRRDTLGNTNQSPNGAKIQACMRRYLNVNTLEDLIKSYNKESGYCEKLEAL